MTMSSRFLVFSQEPIYLSVRPCVSAKATQVSHHTCIPDLRDLGSYCTAATIKQHSIQERQAKL